MGTPTKGKGQGTQWRKQYSQKTVEMLRSMMEDIQLSHSMKKKVNECLRNSCDLDGEPLPATSDPPSTDHPTQQDSKTNATTLTRLPTKPQRRSAELCRSGNSYVREKFRPMPTRDLEKEKRRLQNLLATGQEDPIETLLRRAPREQCLEEEEEEKDRFQEVLDEIEERKQFLADMTALGQGKHYAHIINAEISQKIRELELIEQARRLPADDRAAEEAGKHS